MAEDPQQETINLLTYRINSLTSELTAARAEIERLDTAGIHSCNKDCQRPNCVLRRELKAVTEQRDELAEALRKAISWGDSASHHILYREKINWTYLNEAREAFAAVEGKIEKPVTLIHNGVGIADMYSQDEFENAMKRTK